MTMSIFGWSYLNSWCQVSSGHSRTIFDPGLGCLQMLSNCLNGCSTEGQLSDQLAAVLTT